MSICAMLYFHLCLNHNNKTIRNKPLQVFGFFFNSAFSSKIIVPQEICAYQTVSRCTIAKNNYSYVLCLIFITFRLSAYIFTFPSSVISESTLSFYTCHYNSIPLSYALFHLFFSFIPYAVQTPRPQLISEFMVLSLSKSLLPVNTVHFCSYFLQLCAFIHC